MIRSKGTTHVLVRLATGISAAAMLLVFAGPASLGAPRPDQLKRVLPGSFLVDLAAGLDPNVVAPKVARLHGGKVTHIYDHVVGGFAFRGPDGARAALARDPRVLNVYPDRLMSPLHHRPVARPELEAVRAVQTWHIDTADHSYEGEGAIVAVLDAGVQVSNRNLGNGNDKPGEAGDSVLAVDSCINSDGRGDQTSHGTRVFGVGMGGLGVLPRARGYHVEVSTGALYELFPESNIVCGFNKVKARMNQGMRIGAVNLSYGVYGEIPMVHKAITELRKAGVLTAVAAGNDREEAMYPARYPESVAVSATDKTNSKFADTYTGSFQGSNRGPAIDIAAPGDQVTTTQGSGDIGTSFAAPHVAAAIALLRARDANLSADQIVSRLQRTGLCPGGTANIDGGNCDGAKRPGDTDGYTEPALNVEALIRGQ